jgi:hypothetical protein
MDAAVELKVRPEWIDEILCKYFIDYERGFQRDELEELVLRLTDSINKKLIELVKGPH